MPDPLILSAAVAVAVILLLALGLFRRERRTDHSPALRAHWQSADWARRSRQIRAWTRHRCVIFPWMRATQAHHLHYRRMGREWFLRDAIPVSDAGDAVVHAWIFWNTPLKPLVTWLWRLQALVVVVLVRPWLAVGVLAVLIVVVVTVAHLVIPAAHAAWQRWHANASATWTTVTEQARSR